MTGERAFVDTSFWFALLLKSDQDHAAATELAGSMSSQKLFTTELVLTEFLNLLASKGPHLRDAAIAVVENLKKIAAIKDFNNTQFEPAFQDYKRYSDKEWGLVDCASFIVMREAGLTRVFTFDKHFKQAGFDTIPTQ